ncbi:MAG: protein kinase [Elusimicrobiota bacterium]|nr:protein kinase [Elusimicrobiota bacterium]
MLGKEDIDVFRLNAARNPLESSAALLRMLPLKSKEELEVFRREYSGKIVELMRSLHRASRDRRISPEEYQAVTDRLDDFQLRTMRARDPDNPAGHHGGQPASHFQRNQVDALVDVYIASDSGDKKKAEDAVNSAVQTYPQDHSVQTAAASYYNETRNFPMAEKTATVAIKLDSKDPDAYKARALARASLDDRKGAIEDIKKAMSIDPQDESARVLAMLLESRRAVPTLRSISSVDEIQRALGARDDSPDAVNGGSGSGAGPGALAGGQPAAPDFARSRAYLKTALAKNRLGDYENAVRYAGLAIEKDPANHEAYLERANAYNSLGRYDDSVRDASFVIEKDPANLQAYNMRAWALNRKGRAKDAETDASRAIGINPGYADAWFNRALAYEKQGNYKRMLEDIKQAAALSEAYSTRYQDAVAQYGLRVPGLNGSAAARNEASATGRGARPADDRTPLKRFFILMFFTLTGGALVAAGLVHILSSRPEEKAPGGRITHPDVLSPSVFYEGVATGKYKIERKLGEGAMGVVYEATDQSLGRKVAIKKMSEEIKVNEREKQRFLDEARTVALLHHPGIVEIYTIFEEDDNIYLVFEHVDGRTLDTVLDAEARIPFDRAMQMFGETAGALAYAHSKNVVHRDLKLSNIMLSAEGNIKVMDFGLARRARESMARVSKEVVGSPAYMAPEQELGVSSVESDIYSLGVCLYEALSGVLPFPGPDFHQQKTHRTYQQLSEMLPGMPKGVDALVNRCLSPVPEERFHSADDFRRELDAIV